MKISRFFLDKIVAPLLVMLLTPVAISIGSKIVTGDWLKWFVLIPNILWIVSGLFILLWIIVIAIRKRVKQLRKLDANSGIFVIPNPFWKWIPIGELNYAGVVWIFCAPAPDPWEDLNPSRIYSSSIVVKIPPRCPRCGTEIEESHSFWGGYIWRCVKCGFRKRNRGSYYKESDRAEKIAKREWEKRKYDSSGI